MAGREHVQTVSFLVISKATAVNFQRNRYDLCKNTKNNISLHLSLIASAVKEAKRNQLLVNTNQNCKDKLEKSGNELRKTKDELTDTKGKLIEATAKFVKRAIEEVCLFYHRYKKNFVHLDYK